MPARLLLALLATLLVAGCGGGDETAGGTSSEQPARPSSAEPAQPADESGADAQADDTLARADGKARVETLVTGLEVPWDVAFLPDRRAFVTERPGRIRLVEADGRLRDAPVATVPVSALGEGGLMGIAVDPDWADGERAAYVMVTREDGVRVLRLRWTGSALEEDAVVLDGIEAGPIHDSGRLRFAPDGRLVVVTGDAGDGELAQDRSSRNGKVLALTPRQFRGDGPAADPQVVSIGHRNPQGLDWQPGTGQLHVTEHGPSGFDGPSCCDEMNRVREGGNYAWPAFGDDQPPESRPAFEWTDTIAPSGMAFVSRGGSSWTGQALVAALKGTSLRRMQVGRDGGEAREAEVLLDGEAGRLRAVVEAPDGAIWVTTSNLDSYGERTSEEDDRILRIVPPRG